MQHHPKQLLAYIKEQKNEFVQLIKEFVNIETPSERIPQQEQLLSLLESYLADLDFFTYRLSGSQYGGQLYARPKKRRHDVPYQLLIGHCDTHWPLDTIREMPFDWKRNLVKGPGVYNMKSGLAMLITALKIHKKFDLNPPITPALLIYSDEKKGAPESRPTIERLSRFANRAFVLEPSLEKSGKIITSCKGAGTFQIRIRGESSNAGLDPEAGNGTMLELSQVVQRLYDLNDPERDINVQVSNFDGGIRSNVITGDYKATVHIRLSHPEDIKDIEKAIYNIESTTTGVSLSIDGGIQRPPMPYNTRNQTLWNRASEIARTMDINIEPGTRDVASVGTITSPYTATLDGLGPVGNEAKSAGESILLDKTLERCALLSLLIAEP